MLSLALILVVCAVSAWAGFAAHRIALAWSVSFALSLLTAVIAALWLDVPHGAVTPIEVGAIAFAACFGGSALGLLVGRFARKLRNTKTQADAAVEEGPKKRQRGS
ncbi:MAG: hypothetical protein HZA93_22075 [Verrucomicrobia bacterium]|nr:hypothetical protein [Verrucomicrobiota bacterium]